MHRLPTSTVTGSSLPVWPAAGLTMTRSNETSRGKTLILGPIRNNLLSLLSQNRTDLQRRRETKRREKTNEKHKKKTADFAANRSTANEKERDLVSLDLSERRVRVQLNRPLVGPVQDFGNWKRSALSASPSESQSAAAVHVLFSPTRGPSTSGWETHPPPIEFELLRFPTNTNDFFMPFFIALNIRISCTGNKTEGKNVFAIISQIHACKHRVNSWFHFEKFSFILFSFVFFFCA